MPDNIELQKSLIRGAFHGLLNTASLLCKLSSHNPENIDSLKKIYTKSREIYLFLKPEKDIPTKIDIEKKAQMYLSEFTSEVSEIDMLCKEFASHSEQKDIADFAETLNTLTNDLHLLIKGDSK